MRDLQTGEHLLFRCQRWLSRDEDDGEICRELAAVKDDNAALPSEIVVYDYCNTDISHELFVHCTRKAFLLTTNARSHATNNCHYPDSIDRCHTCNFITQPCRVTKACRATL